MSKVGRRMTTRKTTASAGTIAAGKRIPKWMTSRHTRGTVAVTGMTRRIFRAFTGPRGTTLS